MQKKIDLTTFHDSALHQLIRMNDKLNRKMIDSETWEEIIPEIEKTFIFTDVQLEKVKTDFLSRRK